MSAEKLRGWSNPGWLTSAYRQSLLSLVRFNGNQQSVETNKKQHQICTHDREKQQQGHLCSTHSKQTNVAFSSYCSWNANDRCWRQHLCSSSTTAVAWENCSVTDTTTACAVFTAWEVFLHCCATANKHMYLEEVPLFFSFLFFLLAESSAYVNVSLYSLFWELEAFLLLSRLPFQTETFSPLCELGWNKIRLLKTQTGV